MSRTDGYSDRGVSTALDADILATTSLARTSWSTVQPRPRLYIMHHTRMAIASSATRSIALFALKYTTTTSDVCSSRHTISTRWLQKQVATRKTRDRRILIRGQIVAKKFTDEETCTANALPLSASTVIYISRVGQQFMARLGPTRLNAHR